MARHLDVWLLGARVGTLSQVEGRLSFAYARDATTPLSQSLPIRSEPFDDRATRPFFAGLLPEGGKRMGQITLLAKINLGLGWLAIGAVLLWK